MGKELSASKAGFPCRRNLWYTVNGYSGGEGNDKKTQRIFDVGTALEPVIVDWLRQDGWTVEYNPGSQEAELKVEIAVEGGKIVGHPDCIISKGEIQNALVDIKTMNDRAFTQWKREGTLKSKPQYATQLHIYAAGLITQGRKIEHLGIVGVNKNNSEMYIDLFRYDEFRAEGIKDFAELVFAEEKEPELGCPAESWACNYCEYSEICGLHKKPSAVSRSEEPLALTNDEEIIAAMHELKESRELGREVREMETHAKEVLNEHVRDKGMRGIQGGGLVFTMTERTSQRFDSTAFKEAHPELLSEFTKSSTSVIYDVKEALT